ncbi:hypothetical protein AAG906_019062 [Vitis piasezkii]
MMRSLHVSDGIMSWDGYDDLPVAALPVEFRMPDIDRYTGIGCPRIHLQLYSVVMHGHRLDEAQMIMLFPLSLSGAAQLDVSRRELEALRQRPDELITPFISRTPNQMIQHDQYRLVAPIRPSGPTYLHPPPQSLYFHHQYRAPPPPRPVRQFTQLGMPLSRVFQRLPTSPGFRTGLHCAYHQRAGHDTDSCSTLRHAIQDLIDQGLVDLGRLGVTTDPLPTHDTRAVPSPPGGVHLIDFAGDEIFMMGWDGEAPQPISLYEESDFVGYIPSQPPPVSPIYLQHVPPMTPFILFLEEYNGRVAQPPPIDRPFAGIAAREEVQREDDEILCYLLSSSSTHRDAWVRALGQIGVDTATTSERLIHLLTIDRATCRRVSSVLLDNGSALNVCPLVTAIALGFSPGDFGPSTQTVRAYDGTQRTTMGTLTTHVLRIQSSFNLLLGHPWIHEVGTIPFSFHQKVKFIHEGRLVLHISHSEDDLHLIEFTFDEVQVVSLEDGSRDMVPMSFDQHSSTLVLNMMRGMSYLPEDDARYMAWLRRDKVRARMSGIPFDYPLRPYTFQLADYFIRGSEHTPHTEGTVHIQETVEIQDIQQALGQMHLDIGTTKAPGAMIIASPSPDRASVFSMCFLEKVPDYDLPMDLGNGIDEMDMISIGRILDVAPYCF